METKIEYKVCTGCNLNLEKTVENFYKRGNYLVSRCKKCLNTQTSKKWEIDKKDKNKLEKRQEIRKRNKLKNKEKYSLRDKLYGQTWRGKLVRIKERAKRDSIPFNLNIEQVENLPLICDYTNMKLTKEQNHVNTFSIDRVDSSKGYEINNIVLCSKEINEMKSDRTVEEFVKLCKMVANNPKFKNINP